MILADGGALAGHDLRSGAVTSVDSVLAMQDALGIGRTLLGSLRAVYHDLREGNQEAAQWAREHPGRIEPLGIVHPAYYGEPIEDLLRWMRRDLGMRAVALLAQPSYHSTDWSSPSVRAIGEAAREEGLALQAGIQTPRDLGELVRAWGDLETPVFVRWLDGHRYLSLASERAAARQAPAFLFDIGNACSMGAISHLARAIGAKRLFWATNAPHHLAAPPWGILQEAGLAEEDAARIAHGTLDETLRLPPTPPRTAAALPPWRRLRDTPKVDVHWHPDPWNLGEPGLDAASQRSAFDRFGVERVLVSSVRALNGDLAAGNAIAAAWMDRDPRVRGLAVVSPRAPDESAASLRALRARGFVGVKTIQDAFGMGLNDPAYEPILAEAERLSLPVVAHLPGMREAAEAHPRVAFMATHANWGRAQKVLDLPNVHLEISTGHAKRDESQLRRLVDRVGAERVVYGSDGALVSPAWTLAKLMDADLPPADERKILRENALALFPK